MKILGIDPGSRITGYGIIHKEGNRLIHVDNGAIFTDAHKDFPLRLQRIYRGLTEIIEQYRPDAVAVVNRDDSRCDDIVRSTKAKVLTYGVVSFGGITKEVCFAYTPDVVPGDWVLVHVGFAISRVDAEEAERTYGLLRAMGYLEGELGPGPDGAD